MIAANSLFKHYKGWVAGFVYLLKHSLTSPTPPQCFILFQHFIEKYIVPNAIPDKCINNLKALAFSQDNDCRTDFPLFGTALMYLCVHWGLLLFVEQFKHFNILWFFDIPQVLIDVLLFLWLRVAFIAVIVLTVRGTCFNLAFTYLCISRVYIPSFAANKRCPKVVHNISNHNKEREQS